MFESCHSPHDVAYLLRHRYGLPVQLFAGRPTVSTGSVLGAVVMPPELGRAVLNRLERERPAPVIADPGDGSWTFLVTPPIPAAPLDIHERHTLAGHRVTVVPSGRHVMLPTVDSSLGYHWVGEPGAGALAMPARGAVLAAVHAVTRLTAT
ncbi:hypothetical protein [Nocardia sp. NPDC057227]|uniref:hypothetical protein n=1 Tax=Nocardia sp. NPDC057227 TaxID=3346056 RepID=UPI003641B656